jgi:molecular chaperone GrpE
VSEQPQDMQPQEVAGAQAPATEAAGPVADAAQPVQDDLTELQARAAERDEFLALAQRTQADFENFRKRAMREQGLAEHRGVVRVVKELLPALDNLDRALQAADAADGEATSDLTQGFRLVQAELLAAMARVGVEGYSPKGEVFDPNVHEAMAQAPVEGAASGTVTEVYQQGYRMADTVIRPARVVVAA